MTEKIVNESIVDMKLTRNELMDLIIEELTEDLDKKIRAATRVRDGVTERSDKLDRTAWVRDHLNARTLVQDSISVRRSYGDDSHVTVSLRYEVPMNLKPVALVQAEEALEKELEAANEVLSALRKERSTLTENKGKARIAIIRRSLEGNPEGTKILNMIDGVKDAMKKRLLAAKTEE